MSSRNEPLTPAREYAVHELTWLAGQYFVKGYAHLKLLRETREAQHADMAKVCCHRAGQLFLVAAAKFQGHETPSPLGELPPVDTLISLLEGRLRFEAEGAVRSAATTRPDAYWRDVAQGLRARFERSEPALFTTSYTVMPSPEEFAPMPCPRGGGRVCTWRS
jgi:hypothetical protein